jgi:hypothetical protein
MRVKKYNFIYEHDNEADEISKLLNDQPDLIEYEEEGYLDLDSVVAATSQFDMTQVYLLGGHNLVIDTPLIKFMEDWTSN